MLMEARPVFAWIRRFLLFLAPIAPIFVANAQAQIQMKNNFAERKAIIINSAPFWELSGFSFKNEYSDSRSGLHTDLSWKNVGKDPIVAFEVVILRYDPFNRPIAGSGRWLITGLNSADWSPLKPGQSSEDGLISYQEEPVFTAVAFVRAARMQSGNVWYFDEKAVTSQIQKSLPELKEVGNLSQTEPGTEKKQ